MIEVELLLASLTVLFIVASVVDWVSESHHLRVPMQRIAKALADLETGRVVLSAHTFLCDAFDDVYGRAFLSWRRVRRSCLFSLAFVLCSVVFVGFENTLFALDLEMRWLVGLGASLLLLNCVADYFSLQETRWVMARAGVDPVTTRSIAMWVCVDLVLTTLIWIAAFSVALFSWSRVQLYFEMPHPGEVVWHEQLSGMSLGPDIGLPFLISTYGTSIVWLSFVGFVVVVRVMKNKSRFLDSVLQAISRSKSPARTAAGIAAIGIVSMYGLLRSLSFLW